MSGWKTGGQFYTPKLTGEKWKFPKLPAAPASRIQRNSKVNNAIAATTFPDKRQTARMRDRLPKNALLSSRRLVTEDLEIGADQQ